MNATGTRLALKAYMAVKVVATMAMVSGVISSAAMAGKALHRAYAEAYGGASAVAMPSEAPTARTHAATVPSAVPSQVRAQREVTTGGVEARASLRERRAARALTEWRMARSYARMNVHGLTEGDSERVDRAAQALEDATW